MNLRLAVTCLLLLSFALNLCGQEQDQEVVRITTNSVRWTWSLRKTANTSSISNPKTSKSSKTDARGRSPASLTFPPVVRRPTRRHNKQRRIASRNSEAAAAERDQTHGGDRRRRSRHVVSEHGEPADVPDEVSKRKCPAQRSDRDHSHRRRGWRAPAVHAGCAVLANAAADPAWNPVQPRGRECPEPGTSAGIVANPPEAQMQGRVPPDRSPSSAQVSRPVAEQRIESVLGRQFGRLFDQCASFRLARDARAAGPQVDDDHLRQLATERQEATAVDFDSNGPSEKTRT